LLLIVQAFSNHVNENSEKLRKYFVDFEGKKTLEINYTYSHPIPIELFPYENFTVQINEEMKKYLGKEIVDDLTANFTTTDYNSYLVSKLSIMGSFKKYEFIWRKRIICGSPYIILEGTEDDYKSIISKAKKLRKYEFEWYIDRIIPCVEKMLEAKQGNIDIEFFKNIIQYKFWSSGCGGGIDIFGWIIKFLIRKEKDIIEDRMNIKEFNSLASQMLIVPFKVIYNEEEFDMKYKVGFIGCGQNEKSEVYPVQGWIVYLGAEEEKEYSDNNSPKFSLNGSYRTPGKFLI